MSDLNSFDGILYINLTHRLDRKKQMEEELKEIAHKVFRIEGCFDELNGARGCVLSHIKALEFALDKGWGTVLILEDDCFFQKKRDQSYIDHFFAHFKNDWDVFFLGGQAKVFEKTTHPDYLKVHFSLRAHDYAVNGHYMEKLRAHFMKTYESMAGDLFFVQSLPKALDRQWAELQLEDRWFIGTKPIARQRKSFSDIEKRGKVCR
jgi:GR25 family glycosyltransferase involved in LPS biosynthesis